MSDTYHELNRRYVLAHRKGRLKDYFFWVSDGVRDWVVREILGTTLMMTGKPHKQSFEELQRSTIMFRAIPVYSPLYPPPGMRTRRWKSPRRITRVPSGL